MLLNSCLYLPSWLPQSQSGPRTTFTPWKIPLRIIRDRFCLGAKLTLNQGKKENILHDYIDTSQSHVSVSSGVCRRANSIFL